MENTDGFFFEGGDSFLPSGLPFEIILKDLALFLCLQEQSSSFFNQIILLISFFQRQWWPRMPTSSYAVTVSKVKADFLQIM